jgi:hypothetical protein
VGNAGEKPRDFVFFFRVGSSLWQRPRALQIRATIGSQINRQDAKNRKRRKIKIKMGHWRKDRLDSQFFLVSSSLGVLGVLAVYFCGFGESS